MLSRAMLLQMTALGIALLITVGRTEGTSVGPPWISVEMPANPLDSTTRDAALLVHVYHHSHPVGLPIAGRAEGLVKGERRSLPLEFTRTARPNVYGLKQQWPAEGHWALVISIENRGEASLFIELGPDGGVRENRYFNQRTQSLALRSVQVVQGPVETARIEAALQTLAQSD